MNGITEYYLRIVLSSKPEPGKIPPLKNKVYVKEGQSKDECMNIITSALEEFWKNTNVEELILEITREEEEIFPNASL